MADSPADSDAKLSASPFSHPLFRKVWLASLVSHFGALIQGVGASWTMVVLGGSATMVALVQAATTLPVMLLSLVAGAIADSRDRRLVMLSAQTFMLLVSVMLALCAWLDLLTPWSLLGFTFLLGIGAALNNPSWQASVGDIVPRDAMPAAVAMNSMGYNIARSVGPALGGMLLAAGGAAAAFLVNSLSYIGLIAVLARWRPKMQPRLLPAERIGVAMQAGIRYVSMSPHLRVVLLRATLFGFAGMAVPALMPLIAKERFEGGPITYGLLLGAFGIGAVTGALASRQLRRRLPIEVMVGMALVSTGCGTIGAGLSNFFPLTLIALAAVGGGWVLALSTFNVTVQLASPRWVVGRALAVYQTLVFAGATLGSWLFGELAGWQGVATALAVAGLLELASIPLAFWVPLPKVENLNLDPMQRPPQPTTALSIEPRSGPIIVTIEFRIDEPDIRPFLLAMQERRRIRLRDGARNWSLSRDLEEPAIWVERYQVATWLDYLRHNERHTQADAINSERIRGLHKGPHPPRVRRLIERQTGSLPEAHMTDVTDAIGGTQP